MTDTNSLPKLIWTSIAPLPIKTVHMIMNFTGKTFIKKKIGHHLLINFLALVFLFIVVISQVVIILP